MSSDLNGVGQTQQNQSQPQNNGQQQSQQAPAQNQPQQTQQPSTPQFNILPVNPQTGRVEQPQQTQQPSQQQAQSDQFSAFRQSVATSLGVSLNDVPSDPAALTQIVHGGWQAAQKLRQMEQQGTQPQQPAQTQQQAPNPLQPKQMAPGWERMVVKNQQTGVFEPVHPNFQSVAADANYNEGVYIQRNNALNQGQMLPEQQQSVKEIVAQQLAKEREELRASMFMEANESKLYELNPDGSRRQQVNAQGQLEPVASELGIEMRNAAQEIVSSGAQFQSQHDLAKYALKIAEGRLKIKQAQAQQNNGTGNGPPSQAQPQYNDLAGLLRNHTQSGNQGGGNMNTVPQQRSVGDLRTEYRSTLAQLPDNLNGVDYLDFIFKR